MSRRNNTRGCSTCGGRTKARSIRARQNGANCGTITVVDSGGGGGNGGNGGGGNDGGNQTGGGLSREALIGLGAAAAVGVGYVASRN